MQSSQSEAERSGEAGPAMPRWFFKAFSRLNVWVYQVSGGRFMSSFSGDAICLITMTGAKTGKRRTIPLMYVPYQDGVLLVASQTGAPKNPVWYKNLLACPELVVTQGGIKRELRACVLEGEERAAAWPVCVEHYAPYADYKKRTQREIPVFYCSPK